MAFREQLFIGVLISGVMVRLHCTHSEYTMISDTTTCLCKRTNLFPDKSAITLIASHHILLHAGLIQSKHSPGHGKLTQVSPSKWEMSSGEPNKGDGSSLQYTHIQLYTCLGLQAHSGNSLI